MNNVKKFGKSGLAIILVVMVTMISQISVFAATKSSKTVMSISDMSISVMPGETGKSNTITFNFYGLTEDSIVQEVQIDCSNVSRIGGKGVIMAQSIVITAPDGTTEIIPWKSGNVMKTSLFSGKHGKGTWTVYMTGTNLASSSKDSSYIAGVKYSNVDMKITYVR